MRLGQTPPPLTPLATWDSHDSRRRPQTSLGRRITPRPEYYQRSVYKHPPTLPYCGRRYPYLARSRRLSVLIKRRHFLNERVAQPARLLVIAALKIGHACIEPIPGSLDRASPRPARWKIDGGSRSRSEVSNPDLYKSQLLVRAKVSAPGRRHERTLALVANSHYAAMEACAIAKAKRRPRSLKERVGGNLGLATAPGASPDQSAADRRNPHQLPAAPS
jgi:hypothetical protein